MSYFAGQGCCVAGKKKVKKKVTDISSKNTDAVLTRLSRQNTNIIKTCAAQWIAGKTISV